MTLLADAIKAKIRSLYDWYSKGAHGSSERFNDGRLSALTEIERWIDHEEAVPNCPDWCDNPAHKTQEQSKTK